MNFLITFFILIFSAPLMAADSFLPSSFHSIFSQVTVSIVSGKEQVSTGMLDYQYPSNLRLEIEKPDPLILVSNKQKTWFYRPSFIEGERDELTVKDSGDSELSQFLDILKSGLKNNSDYTVTTKANNVHLTFSASGTKRIGIIAADLEFSGTTYLFSQLKKIKVTPSSKKNFELRFSTIEIDKPFSAQHFIFSKP